MGAFAWLYWFQLGWRAQQYWGKDAAEMIAQAPTVELLLLNAPQQKADATELVLYRDKLLPVKAKRILTPPAVPGWANVRTLFLRDAAYDWNENAAKTCQPDWRYAVRFLDRDQQTIMLLSTKCPRAAMADGFRQHEPDGSIRAYRFRRSDRQPVSIEPIQQGLTKFLDEQFFSKK